MSLTAVLPPPAVSAWGSGPPPAIKPLGMAGGLSGLGPPLPGVDPSWESLPGARSGAASQSSQFSNLGDMFDPMGGGGFGSMDQISSAGDFLDPMSGPVGNSQGSAHGADSAGTSSSIWETSAPATSHDNHGGMSSSDTFRIMEPFSVLEMMLNANDDDDEEMCTICFDALANGCLRPCGHKFCGECIKQFRKRAVSLATEGVMCPHCRQPVKEFQLPEAILASAAKNKSAWGTSSPAPAPAPIPQPLPRAPPAPRPQPAKQSNGPAAKPAPTPPPAPTVSPPPPPAQIPTQRVEPQEFGSFGGGGSGGVGASNGSDLWSGGGGGSLQMPAASSGMGGFGSIGGGGWSGSSFGGLPGLNNDPVFAAGNSSGLWGGSSGGVGMDSWSSGGGGPSALDGSTWDSFQMPGGAGGFGGGGFGPGGGMGLGGGNSMQSGFGSAGGVGGGGMISVKVRFSDDKDLTVSIVPTDSGKRLRMKIKQMTGRQITGMLLSFNGKLIRPEESLESLKLTNGNVILCIPQETTDEKEEDALRGESFDDSAPMQGFGAMMQTGAVRSVASSSIGRGLGAIGIGGLMSMDDDRRSNDSGSVGRGAGLSQEDDDWEAVGKKKKVLKGGSVATSSGVTYGANFAGMPPPSQIIDGKQGKMKDGKIHFFGLWVGNVHSEVVDQDELRGWFERFGELCNSRVHGVPPLNILPDSSSAFVNFCRYEDADAARNTLQGRTVAGTGPLRINASDLMQAYEDRLKGIDPGAGTAKSVLTLPAAMPSQGFSHQQQPARAPTPAMSMWNAPPPPPSASVWGGNSGGGGGGGFVGGIPANVDFDSDMLTKEELAKIARMEQERKDEELARQLAKQEQYEASNAFYIQQAQQRKRQAGGNTAIPMGGGGGGYPEPNFMFDAPPLGGGAWSSWRHAAVGWH